MVVVLVVVVVVVVAVVLVNDATDDRQLCTSKSSEIRKTTSRPMQEMRCAIFSVVLNLLELHKATLLLKPRTHVN